MIGRPSASTTSRPDHDVLDLAVARRVLAGRPAGQPSADGRQLDRLRPVPEGETVVGPQLGFEVGARRCRRSTSTMRLASSTATTPWSAVRSSSDAAVHGDAGAAHAAAAAGGGDRDPGLVADREHGGHLVGGRRPAHGRGQGRRPGRRGPRSSPAATSRGWPRHGRARSVVTSAHAERSLVSSRQRTAIGSVATWATTALGSPSRTRSGATGWAGPSLRRRARRRRAPSRAGRRPCARAPPTPGTPSPGGRLLGVVPAELGAPAGRRRRERRRRNRRGRGAGRGCAG